ncbi:hypothetical protein AAFF_G00286260 [Aldrovandia affinis]|uniref:Uncharacterized protein n=1 Tax=Aldrovandia affinis TaxID=143900 RepID=A0AAD7TAI4_9TELE|nr:hypothetical protein AAFF_G00286260 [Aldrovandia affinis]
MAWHSTPSCEGYVRHASESRSALPAPATLNEALEKAEDREGRDCTRTTITQHHIETGAAVPIQQRARQLPLANWEEAEAKIHEMVAAGIIQPSDSPWVSLAVLMRDDIKSHSRE